MRIHVDLLEEDGDLLIYQGAPFTGVAYELFKDGSLCHEVSYLEGLPHGCWRDWYSNGKVKFESECWSGLRHGKTKRWYESGFIHVLSEYEFGIETQYLEWSELGEELVNRVLGPDSPGENYKILIQRREKFLRN